LTSTATIRKRASAIAYGFSWKFALRFNSHISG
jgi:hypothetical protein